MSKSLSNILTVFKVARIVAKVVGILCIVGAGGCILGIAMLPLVGVAMVSPMLNEAGVELASVYGACIVGLITCAGEAVFALMAERYCGNVLTAQTPFTEEGAKESFRLGLVSIIISLAISLVSGIAVAVVALIASEANEANMGASVSLTTGLFFMFLSLVFRHGAELRSSATEVPAVERMPDDAQQ